MPLINLTKEELKKVEYYLLGDTDPLIVSVLEKIRSLDEVCECNNTSNVSTTGVELEDVDDSWYDEDGNIKCQSPLKFPINEGIQSHKFFEFLL